MGAWPWRRKDRPEDRRLPSAPPARQRPGHEADSAEPRVTGAPAKIRLGVNVLPEPGRPPRHAAGLAPDAALHDGTGPSVELAAAVEPGSSASAAEEHVRRALALAELSMLVLDQD